MSKQRLQKVLAAAGVASRRKCEELILEGTVCVNGGVVDSLPAFVDPEKDIITVDGRKIYAARKVYFLLNKPKGVICTNSDPQGRKKAIDIIPGRERIFCVGRLDIESTGIIILTNDNELANRLTHPRYGLAKTYVVNVKGELSGEQIEKLKKGVWLAEGKTGRATIKILKRNRKESLAEVTIREGLNREVRRMFAKMGLPVKSLTRTQIGKINARGLGIGKFRALTKAEVEYLKKTTN
ncbi:MAG: pseudouridine synthase [Phycisphaerae bacterium]|nr:pseudouridine synthase [Phycisphaerae bacterium]MDD5381297.1 pseudouridine synthase [Phycisphaerae bacterium]